MKAQVLCVQMRMACERGRATRPDIELGEGGGGEGRGRGGGRWGMGGGEEGGGVQGEDRLGG